MHRKLWERGYSVIPVKGKAPVIPKWERFSDVLPTEKEIEEFERYKHPQYGCGVVCGPASNLLVIDIDSDRMDLHNLCPPSPVRRIGAYGEARFFQYNPEILNHAFKADLLPGEKKCGVDILSAGKQIVVPPSIHPDTKNPYVWLTPDTLENLNSKDLPILTLEELWRISAYFGRPSQKEASETDLKGRYTSDGKRCAHGSHDRLKKLAAILVAKRISTDEATQDLLDYDKEHHLGVTYFEDNSRPECQADPQSNAAKFYSNIRAAINRSRIHKGLNPEIGPEIKEVPPEVKPDIFLPYPEPRGMMKSFYDYCSTISNGNQDALGLGASLAFMSILCANRFMTIGDNKRTWPNMYIINLACSGVGKGVPQQLISSLLGESGMVGSGDYSSGVAAVASLPERQERLDIIDECSSFLKSMHMGEHYQRDLVEVLNTLFSASVDRYWGKTSLTHKENFGGCYNPCVSILASTTPIGFTESVNRNMAGKGLMPRALIFYQKNPGSYNRSKDFDRARVIKKSINEQMHIILNHKKLMHPDFKSPGAYASKDKEGPKNWGVHYRPTLIPFTPQARAVLLDYASDMYSKGTVDSQSFESPFYARFAELATKVALVDAISIGEKEIGLDSLNWAINVVNTQWANIQSLYELVTAENQTEARHIRVLRLIKESGTISKKDLIDKTRWLKEAERSEIIKSLKDIGKITEYAQKNPNKRGPAPAMYAMWNPELE